MISPMTACDATLQRCSNTALSCRVGFVLFATFFGCGERNELVPVSGLVTVDGKPVAAAQVLFMSADHRPAAAETDAQGRYVLSTYTSGDGAAIGTYSVTVTTRPPIGVKPTVIGPTTGRATIQPWTKPSVPVKYSDPSNPILSVVVKPGVNDIPFELSEK